MHHRTASIDTVDGCSEIRQQKAPGMFLETRTVNTAIPSNIQSFNGGMLTT